MNSRYIGKSRWLTGGTDVLISMLKYTFENFIKNHKVLMRKYISSNQFIKQLAYGNPQTLYFTYTAYEYSGWSTTASINNVEEIIKKIRKNQSMIKFILDNGVAVYVNEDHDVFYFYMRKCQLCAEENNNDI